MKTAQRGVSFLLTLLLLLSFLPAALAENDDTLITEARRSILDRCQTEDVEIQTNQKVSAENGIDYSITDVTFRSEDGNGTMQAQIYLDVCQGESSDLRIGLMNFGFMMLALPQDYSSLEDLQAYLPNHVFDLTDGRYQELAWPVSLDKTHTLSLCLTYSVPKTLQNFGFSQTNLFGSGAGDLTAKGPIYTYSFTRSANDFNLFNNTTKTITEIHASPTGTDDKENNLLEPSGLDQLEGGQWMTVAFDNSSIADTVSDNWILSIYFEDGTIVYFSGLDLHNIIDLNLEEEDGQLTINAQY